MGFQSVLKKRAGSILGLYFMSVDCTSKDAGWQVAECILRSWVAPTAHYVQLPMYFYLSACLCVSIQS